MGSVMLMIDASIANIVLPTLTTELGVESSRAVLVVTVYQLMLAMALMPLAALGARIGYRRLYCAGLVLHSLAAMFCFAADHFSTLVVARAVQALGAAAAMSVAFGLVRSIYPTEKLGKGLAINTIANASGTALAPAVGGMVVSVLSWHWVFAAAVPFSLLALLLSRAMPDPEPQTQPFDLGGAALCAVTFGLVVIGFQLTTDAATRWTALALLAAGALVAWVLVRHERQVQDPVLPLDLLGQRVLGLAVLANLSAVIGSMLMLVYLPFLLQEGFKFSPAEVGGLMASYALASVMVAPASGYLSDRIPIVYLCTTGMVIAAIGLVFFANLPADPARSDIVWRLWLYGAGFGMFFSPNARFMVSAAPHRRSASAGSMVTTSRMLGQAIGATVVAGLLALDLGGTLVPFVCALVLVAIAGITSVLNLSR